MNYSTGESLQNVKGKWGKGKMKKGTNQNWFGKGSKNPHAGHYEGTKSTVTQVNVGGKKGGHYQESGKGQVSGKGQKNNYNESYSRSSNLSMTGSDYSQNRQQGYDNRNQNSHQGSARHQSGKGKSQKGFSSSLNNFPTSHNNQSNNTFVPGVGKGMGKGKGLKGKFSVPQPDTNYTQPQRNFEKGKGKTPTTIKGGRGGMKGTRGVQNHSTEQLESRSDLRAAFDILEVFLESSDTSMEFPSVLTAYQRNKIHSRCHVLGLLSKSRGPENCRILTISKKINYSDGNQQADLPSLSVDPFIRDADLQLLEDYEKSGFVKAANTAVTRTKIVDKKRRKMFTFNETFTNTKFKRSAVDPAITEFVAGLPIRKQEGKLKEMLKQTDVIVLSGETGSGKSTQAPQMILDSNLVKGKILCTQPRRISAITVSDRIATERGVSLGSEVGYQIRFEGKRSPDTKLLFMTTGILFNFIRDNPTLPGIGCIVIDEVHERDADMDFSLLILRNILRQKSSELPLKIVLMSATLSKEVFVNYFTEFSPGSISIAGRTFPVKQYFLEDALRFCGRSSENDPSIKGSKLLEMTSLSPERQQALGSAIKNLDVQIDYELILKLLINIEKFSKSRNEAVLVFLPGWGAITKLDEVLRFSTISKGLRIVKCHSSVSSVEQQAIFRPPPRGLRKIVLSTNIAETGITVPDVVYVIDTALQKQVSYSGESDVARLDNCYISKSSVHQRMGRAGRTQEGVCYSLISKPKYAELLEFSKPELLRTPLESILLQAKSFMLDDVMDMPITDVLKQCPDAPPDVSIVNAKIYLHNCGALDHNNNLTYLGKVLSSLPFPPLASKLLLFGIAFRVAKPMIIIAAFISGKKPFIKTSSKVNSTKTTSDHIYMLELYKDWKSLSGESQVTYCLSNDLSHICMLHIDRTVNQIVRLVSECGFIPKDSINEYTKFEDNEGLVKAVLFAGLWPNVVHVSPAVSHKKKKVVEGVIAMYTPEGKECYHGGDSFCCKREAIKKSLEMGVYFEKLYINGKLSISEVTFFSAIPTLIFCRDLQWESPGESFTAVSVEGFRTVNVPNESVPIIKQLRNLLVFFFQKSLERVDASVVPEDLVVLFSRLIGYDTSQKDEINFSTQQTYNYDWSTDGESEDSYSDPELVDECDYQEGEYEQYPEQDQLPIDVEHNEHQDDDVVSSESSSYQILDQEGVAMTAQKSPDLSFLESKPGDEEKFSFLSPISK